MKTIGDMRADFEEKVRKQRETIERELATLSELPQNLPAPVVLNSNKKFFDKEGAWLSFGNIVGRDEYPSSLVLQSLEKHGIKPMGATLVKWDNYRPSVEPGFQFDIPESKGRYKTTWTDTICPLWLMYSQHTKTQACAFYLTPRGKVLYIHLYLSLPFHAHANMERNSGNTKYVAGTQKLVYPDHWNALYDCAEDGGDICLAQISSHSRAYIENDRTSLNGRLMWTPTGLQDEFELTPSQMLKQLIPSND